MLRLLPLLGLLWLAGCGFHLKGYHQASPNLDGLFIEQSDEEGGLAAVVRQQLLISDVKLAGSPEQAKNLLRISQERFSQRVISVDAYGKVLEYELLLEAKFTVSTAGASELAPLQSLELTRQLSFSGADELGRRSEGELMHADMLSDMADQIIRQLQAQLK
jgi:LPS-assembly lipoprotein